MRLDSNLAFAIGYYSLMTQPATDPANNCPACGAANETGMLFCVSCGSQLGGGAAPRGFKCPNCGRLDEMSQTFCVYCGCSMAQAALRGEAGRKERRMPARANEASTKPSKNKSREPNLIPVALLAGLAAGAALAFVARQCGALDLIARSNWPDSGLVIYATPPEILVTVEERTGKKFTVGKTGRTGSLAIPDLPPGSYRVILSAPGRLSVIKDIQADGRKAVVLGFPERIDLPAEQR